MNIGVTLTVGSVMFEANAQDCGPDAAGDLLWQVTVHMLSMVDRADIAKAARSGWTGDDDDEPTDGEPTEEAQ